MTDEETVDSLRSEEVAADDNEDVIDKEITTFLHTAMLLELWT
jgi:hypothetical protein